MFYGFKTIFWNCQGTGHPRFHNFMAEYRRDCGPNVTCLFGTMVSGIHANGIIRKLSFANSFRIEARGFSGGIWILWSDSVLVDILDLHPQMILMRVRSKQGTSNFLVSAVYANTHVAMR